MAKILIPTPLRQFVEKNDSVVVSGATVGELLGSLTTQFADLRKHLYNDEGKLRGLPPNPLATALWWHFNPSAVHADFLVGPVIVTGYDPAGHDTDVPEDVIDTIVALAYSSAST